MEPVMEAVTKVSNNAFSILGWITQFLSTMLSEASEFIFSFVVFWSCLYYLLWDSKETYTPIRWINQLRESTMVFAVNSKTVDSNPLNALEKVAVVTVKLALFTGLFTWVSITLSGAMFPYLISLLAAILAPFPVIPTYVLVILPVVELFIRGERFTSLVLFTVHIVANWFIIPLFYSQIEGQHPYMTGLSVLGGIYAFGIDGVIVGPVVLSVFLALFDTIVSLKSRSQEPL